MLPALVQNQRAKLTHRRFSIVLRNGGASTHPHPESRSCLGPPDLLLEHFPDLSDLLLDLAGLVLGLAFRLQVGIVRDLAHVFLDFAFHFMKSAFDLILCACAHGYSPYR